MRILIINQYVPPDVSPTARLAGDLAEFLGKEGHEVQMVARGSGYRRKYRGMFRLVAEAVAWVSLFFKALRAGSTDLVIVFSSPPLVLLAGVVVARLRRAELIHWVLDAYPDVAEALEIISSSLLNSGLRHLVGKAYRQCRQVVAVSSAMQTLLRERYGVKAECIYPWPPQWSVENINDSPWRGVPDGFGVWCYSGNLGQAHEWSVLLDVQQKLESQGVPLVLVIQGGGSGWESARREVGNRRLKQVVMERYVEEDLLVSRLHKAQVRVATLKTCVSGMLWPSKWALMECLPGPHLWIGPSVDLGADSGEGVYCFEVSRQEEIASWLCGVSTHRPSWNPETFKVSVDRKRSAGLTGWSRMVGKLCKNKNSNSASGSNTGRDLDDENHMRP